MSAAYEEIVDGETLLRKPPDARHERIRSLLHQRVAESLGPASPSRLLEPRSVVRIGAGTMIRPDIALIASATGKLWLAAEVISSHDHRIDTVTKKHLYEEMNVPRLWMVDPRYDNVEIYQGSPHGLILNRILAGREILTERLLPGLQITIQEIFRADI